MLAAWVAVVAGAGCNQVLGLDAPGAPRLTSLTLSRGTLDPGFDPATRGYRGLETVLADRVSVAATAPDGMTVTLDGAPLAPGAWSDPIALSLDDTRAVRLEVSDGDRATAYDLTLDRGAMPPVYTRVAAPVPETAATFGDAVAIDGDLLVVGAGGAAVRPPMEDCDGNATTAVTGDSGLVYTFHRDGATWIPDGMPLAPPPGTRCGRFGMALALRGDRLVVGNPYETRMPVATPLRYAGGAYWYLRDTRDRWNLQAWPGGLPAAAGAAQLGFAVALGDDVIAVSAVGAVAGAQAGAGAIYLWTDTTATTLRRNLTAAYEYFGVAMLFDGARLYASAPGTDVGSLDAGAIDVFQGNGIGAYQLIQTLTVNDAGAQFGDSMAVRGTTLVAGAPAASAREGAAWVFADGGLGAPGPRIQAANLDPEDLFGFRVALIGDLVAVSACTDDRGQAGWSKTDVEDDGVTDAGVVYLYRTDGETPALVGVLASPEPGIGAAFGCPIVADDRELLVGARGGTDGGNLGAGVVWVIE